MFVYKIGLTSQSDKTKKSGVQKSLKKNGAQPKSLTSRETKKLKNNE